MVKNFRIEYEIPPMRGIYTEYVTAISEESAREFFESLNARTRIRKIEETK